MHSEEQNDLVEAQLQFARHNFDNQQGLIRAADTKAAVYVTLLIFLGGSAVPLARDVVQRFHWSPCWPAIVSGLYVLSCVGFLIGFVLAAVFVHHVIKPRGARHYGEAQLGHEMHFFGHIKKYANNQKYFEAVASAQSDLLLRNLTDQIFELATICDEKMAGVAKARIPIFIAFCSWALNLSAGLWILHWRW